MQYTDSKGETAEFECEPTIASAWVSRDILAGQTYPNLDFIGDVHTVVDAGANCGAASVYFAQRHPRARVHAIEPGSRQRQILERNANEFPNIQIHPVGLDAVDHELPLYFGGTDSGMSSVVPGQWTGSEHELVQLRDAASWAAETGIDAIDILKVDVEGLEVAVLTSFATLLPSVKVLYVEYDSREARHQIDNLVGATHELFIGKLFIDQGEITYLRRDLAGEAATNWLQSISLQ